MLVSRVICQTNWAPETGFSAYGCILYSVIVLRGNGSRARATPASVQRFFTSVCVPFIIQYSVLSTKLQPPGDHCVLIVYF